MRRLSSLGWLLVIPLFCAVGCSLRSYQVQPVHPDFVVVVTHRSKPIAGAEVRVITGAEGVPAIFSTKTDGSGTAQVEGLPPGKYYLVATYRDIEAGREWIEVNATTRKAGNRFKFQWADYSEQVKRVSGSLSGRERGNTGNPLQDLIHSRKVPERGVQIELRSAFSDEKYTSVSDSEGRFRFDWLRAGTYILIIGGAKSISGTVADTTTFVIDLIASAKIDFLPLGLKDGGCGGAEYELQNRADQGCPSSSPSVCLFALCGRILSN